MNKQVNYVHVHKISMVYMCVAVAAVPWYNICIVLQIDQCIHFIIVFKQNSDVIREMPDNWHIVDVIYIHMHVAALPRPVTMIKHLYCFVDWLM